MTMTLQEAQAEYADASANYAAAKATGDAETILAAKTQLAQAQAAIVKAKANPTNDLPESALKKENAELKAKIARLSNLLQEESDEKWKAFNKVRELEWALREAKGEKMPNFGAQTAIIPTAKKGYPPFKFDASDMFPDWDELP